MGPPRENFIDRANRNQMRMIDMCYTTCLVARRTFQTAKTVKAIFMTMETVFKSGYLEFDAEFLHPYWNDMRYVIKNPISIARFLERSRVLTFEEGVNISGVQRAAGVWGGRPARAGVDGHPPADMNIHPKNQIQGVPGKRCEWLRVGVHKATRTGAIDDA